MRIKTKIGMITEIVNPTGLNPMFFKLKNTSGGIPKSTPAMIRSKDESKKGAQSSKGFSTIYSA